MLNAQSGRSVAAFEFECLPAALEKRLAAEVDRLAGQLSENEKFGSLPTTAGQFEIESLEGATMADLHRMKRSRPPTREEPYFRLPGEEPFIGAPRIVNVDTPLGAYLLEKAINRLEVILFLTPDDVRAAYALGFCHSIHLPGIYRPERADELLRQVYAADPRSKQAALALEYLMQIGFDDRTGELDAGGEAAAVERIWFAFEHMPADARDSHWSEYLRLAGNLLMSQNDYDAMRDLLAKTAPFIKQCDGGARRLLAFRLAELARSLAMVAKKRPEIVQQALDLLHTWGAGDDAELAVAANVHLLEMLEFKKDYLAAAEVAEQAAGRIVDLQLEQRRDRRDYFLIQAGRNYRLAADPAKALKLLLSFEVRVPRPGVLSQGLPDLTGTRLCEIGACYEALGRRDEARTTYVQAAERNPSIVKFPTYRDLNLWIDGVGGYPQCADCDVEVRYVGGPKINRVLHTGGNAERWILPGRCLATDGRKLYVCADKELQAFDVAGEAWQPLTAPAQTITCLLVHQGQLWAGTDKDGLWQSDLAGGPWRAVAADRLPDRHVELIAAAGKEVYVGVGTTASGGLVRIDPAGQAHVFGGNLAPAVGPTHIVVSGDVLLARTPQLIHRWSFRDQNWSTAVDPCRPKLFAGTSAIWASGNGQELKRWGDSAAESQRFHAAWYQRENLKDYLLNYTTGTYAISFVAEHGDEVWFGGQQFVPYVSSGVYRFNLKTGAFRRFGPGDGFKNTCYHAVFDGLWLEDRLWLATSEGLCRVTPRAGGSLPARPAE